MGQTHSLGRPSVSGLVDTEEVTSVMDSVIQNEASTRRRHLSLREKASQSFLEEGTCKLCVRVSIRSCLLCS